jgi:alanyl-tRNA synthetase
VTERLYYSDSFLLEFDANAARIRDVDGRIAIVLDRTAFYPTSGGQVFDTGLVALENGTKLGVIEVQEDETGEILHFIEPLEAGAAISAGMAVHGSIDASRRRDHMQQHTGQHVLSAAFIRALQMPTVSFHMGPESCTIDLDTKSLNENQAQQAEALANRVVTEDRPVEIRYATAEEARSIGIRKIPAEPRDRLRLIDIADFDLTACGGTHVRSTGQIGAILLRKLEKVKQGVRVEFVCGARAVRTARDDYSTLREAAALYSAHIRDVPQLVRKSLEEIRAGQKEGKNLLKELAMLQAASLLQQAHSTRSGDFVVRHFTQRDLTFIKLVAQRIVTTAPNARLVVSLLSAGSGSQASVVFAQTAGGPHDMGGLVMSVMEKVGGRGGGSKDMAQGSAPAGAAVETVIRELAGALFADGERQGLT